MSIFVSVMALFNLQLFPKFSALVDNPMVDRFIEEAIRVYRELPVNPGCVRSRDQWDNPIQTNPLLDDIKKDSNGYWIIAQDNPDWLNYPLMYFDAPVGGKADELCPTIMQFLKSLGNVRIAGFSLFKPGGFIPPHTDSTGLTNNSLACHVCLTGTGELTLKEEVVHQSPKRVYIFDSEILHSVRNTGEDTRIILYIDFVYSKHVREPMKVSFHTACKKQRPNPTWYSWFRSIQHYCRQWF